MTGFISRQHALAGKAVNPVAGDDPEALDVGGGTAAQAVDGDERVHRGAQVGREIAREDGGGARLLRLDSIAADADRRTA